MRRVRYGVGMSLEGFIADGLFVVAAVVLPCAYLGLCAWRLLRTLREAVGHT